LPWINYLVPFNFRTAVQCRDYGLNIRDSPFVFIFYEVNIVSISYSFQGKGQGAQALAAFPGFVNQGFFG
jgi:hypothetical protein